MPAFLHFAARALAASASICPASPFCPQDDQCTYTSNSVDCFSSWSSTITGRSGPHTAHSTSNIVIWFVVRVNAPQSRWIRDCVVCLQILRVSWSSFWNFPKSWLTICGYAERTGSLAVFVHGYKLPVYDHPVDMRIWRRRALRHHPPLLNRFRGINISWSCKIL